MRSTKSAIFRTFALIILTFLQFSSVLAQSSVVETIRIVPSAATSEVSANNLFEEVVYIPLQTTKKSLFGAIEQLAVTEDIIIVSDRESNAILIFQKDGRFINKISRSTSQRSTFWIDNFKQEIVFLKDVMMYEIYNFKGIKVRQEKIKKMELSENLHFFPNDVVAHSSYLVNFKFLKDTTAHEIILTHSGKIYKEFLPYNMKKEELQSDNLPNRDQGPFFASGNSEWVYFARPFDYTVYELTNQNLLEKYKFVFPANNSFLRDDFSKPLFKSDSRQYFRSNPDLISKISHIYRVNNCLSFKLTTSGKNFGPFLYSLESQSLYSFLKIIPDHNTFFLPISDEDRVSGFSDQGVIYCDGKYMYSVISSLQILNKYKDNIQNHKGIEYPQTLQTFLKNGSRMDNPIIIQIKVKNNF